MPAYRCSICGIDYPKSGNCQVCMESLWWLPQVSPDENIEELVRIKTIARHTEPSDKTVNWRFEEFWRAGYDLKQANELAMNRSIDIERARALARKAGAETAYSTLV